jgi:hypothetical protein
LYSRQVGNNHALCNPTSYNLLDRKGIHLVVSESLKKSKETYYNSKIKVITFREFFDEETSSKRPSYQQM